MIDSPILTTWLNWNQFSQFLISSRSIRTFKRLRRSLNQLKLDDRCLGERTILRSRIESRFSPDFTTRHQTSVYHKANKDSSESLLNRTFHSVSSTKETKIKEKKIYKNWEDFKFWLQFAIGLCGVRKLFPPIYRTQDLLASVIKSAICTRIIAVCEVQ